VRVRFRVNGVEREVDVKPYELLADVLREKLGLRALKKGCWRGECGLCTILMDGEPVKSCIILAVEADGSEIYTPEGLSEDGRPSPLQEAFIKNAGLQCGFCTPGFIVVGEYIARKPRITRKEVKEALSGTICRCTGYKQIVDAIIEAHEAYREEG
jgi:carbon-monoxide dehydrogenase small subunit